MSMCFGTHGSTQHPSLERARKACRSAQGRYLAMGCRMVAVPRRRFPEPTGPRPVLTTSRNRCFGNTTLACHSPIRVTRADMDMPIRPEVSPL